MTALLAQEIAQQPEVLRNLLTTRFDLARASAGAIRAFAPEVVVIAARGTADNAARYGQYALGIHARLPVALAAPSLHTLYGTPPRMGRALVIGISQSGMAADVSQVLRDARAQGALTVAITNRPGSTLAETAQYHFPLDAGEELSVAATKTYTAQLTAIAMLVTAITGDAALEADLHALPDQVAQPLASAEPIVSEWAQRLRDMTSFVTVGRGYNYCTAIEVCLKVQELCGIIGQGYSEADFLHGPIAVVREHFPVIVIAPQGKGSAQLPGLLTRLHERKALALVITNDQALGDQTWVRLPQATPEWLSPIPGILPGQLFGLHLALARNLPVDKPSGLSKVTVTL